MFTEQILKSILSLKTFCAARRANTPALEGIHIRVDAETRTITALATDRYAAARMVIRVPEVAGTSWERNVTIATLNAALATVKASGTPVPFFPESDIRAYPTKASGIIDTMIRAASTADSGDFNAKYLSALAKINVGGDKSGRWTVRTAVQRSDTVAVATATYGDYEVSVAIMPMLPRN